MKKFEYKSTMQIPTIDKIVDQLSAAARKPTATPRSLEAVVRDI